MPDLDYQTETQLATVGVRARVVSRDSWSGITVRVAGNGGGNVSRNVL